ncbi:unnamed protein product, partial [Ixodes hexagonus]
VQKPDTAAWLRVAEGFNRNWQFPNCVGGADGKHIQIHAPANSRSMYFNYKGTYSIVLMAIVDSDYRFVVVDVGAYGKQSDGGVLKQSVFGKLLEQGRLGLPNDQLLPQTRLPAPCVFVGDEAFQLRPDFLRPYPGPGCASNRTHGPFSISLYPFKTKRRCAEKAFGILVTRWRILERKLGEEPQHAEELVKALCVLHNFLMAQNGGNENAYCGPGYADSVNGVGEDKADSGAKTSVSCPSSLLGPLQGTLHMWLEVSGTSTRSTSVVLLARSHG